MKWGSGEQQSLLPTQATACSVYKSCRMHRQEHRRRLPIASHTCFFSTSQGAGSRMSPLGNQTPLLPHHCDFACCCLACSKTLQVLTLLWTLLRQGPKGVPVVSKAIVVAPATLVENWGKEVRVCARSRVVAGMR